jgi:hypothetical protein
MVFVDPHLKPDNIIVDVREHYRELQARTNYIGGVDRAFCNQVVETLCEYLCCSTDAIGNIDEYANDTQQAAAEDLTEEDSHAMGTAIATFGVAMYSTFLEYGAYNPEDLMLYEFMQHLEPGVFVMRAMRDEDFIN